jgi:hypothetical protein
MVGLVLGYGAILAGRVTGGERRGAGGAVPVTGGPRL